MIHQYRNNGYNIVLDVNSGAVHVVDELCYDVIAHLAAGEEPDEAFLEELAEASGVPPGLFAPLYKTIGIALVVQVGGNLCRDAGESALAAVVETAGTLCALLAALPLLRAVLDMLLELMG